MLVFDVGADQILLEAALTKAKIAEANSSGTRAHPGVVEAGDDGIGPVGTAAEVCVLKMLDKIAPISGTLPLWSADTGPNYGEDIKKSLIPGLDKPLEVKSTPVLAYRAGILFMRCKKGTAERGGKLEIDYWLEHLPDSYYILLHQRSPRGRPHKFKVLGWATRQMFLDKWDGNAEKLALLDKNGPGWPAICLGHWELRKMADFCVPFGLQEYPVEMSL